ncbi:MAG: FAD-dependent oxidoreductase, partial [Rhodobacteraceae bacterium]|nr:FAD-dependent oxidoreductase [Paracoccaceae bacterium]
MSQKEFPTHARVVIVGGGVMGVGLAYHLGKEGWGADTVLLEKAELTSGSTWHAAGQITHSTSSFSLGKCVDYNIDLYSGALEKETGQPVTWHGCGSFRLAYTEDEMDWLRHTLSVGRTLGFEWLVESEKGSITCEHVVNAGGTYARQMGEWSGLQLPMTSMTHHYFVTDNVPEFQDLETELPVIRDDRKVSGYIRMEQKRGLIGIYEKENSNSVWHDECPWEYENWLFDADYDRVMPYLEESLNRMPIFAELGIQREVHGAISHPPDGNPLVGPAPGVQNYWCCCGTQIGIGWGPGLTRELARWMVHGAADISMRDYDPRRFGEYATKDWQVTKAHEDYCLRHEIPFPHFNRLAGRPIKPSPLYDRLKEKGAVYEEVYGHERPRWFAKNGVEQRDYYSFKRNEVHDVVGAECRAVRESVGIMDISAFTKVAVSGAGAEDLLNRLVANKLPKKVGGIALTHMLNRAGRIELETTVVKLDEGRYYLVCAAFFEQRLVDHLNHNRDGEEVSVKILSTDWSALAINGPQARAVMAACTDADLSNAGFPWLKAKEIEVAGVKLWAFRMSYAGELGWELHIPSDGALAVYDALWTAGEAHGIQDYGSFAMNSLRMEKAFKGAGELTNEVTLAEADV